MYDAGLAAIINFVVLIAFGFGAAAGFGAARFYHRKTYRKYRRAIRDIRDLESILTLRDRRPRVVPRLVVGGKQ